MNADLLAAVKQTEGGKSVAVGGEWAPLDFVKDAKSVVKDAVSDKNKTDGSLVCKQYAVVTFDYGSAIGLFWQPKKGAVKITAPSLAAHCSAFSLKKETPNCVFAFRFADSSVSLIGVRNNLPVYDRYFAEDEIKLFLSEANSLLAEFSTGCIKFGSTGLLASPVNIISVEDVLSEDANVGKLIRLGSSQYLILISVALALIAAGIGYYFYSKHQEEVAEREQQAFQQMNQVRQKTPEEIFLEQQQALLSQADGCSSESMGNAFKKIGANRFVVRGFMLKSATADCGTGKIDFVYESGTPVDFSVRKADPRLLLDESLTNARMSLHFDVQKPKLDLNDLLPWQDWLVAVGTQKQRVSRVGIAIDFKGHSSNDSNKEQTNQPNITPSAAAKTVLRGEISITGNARHLLSALGLVNNVSWRSLVINAGDAKNILFHLKGEYYAVAL